VKSAWVDRRRGRYFIGHYAETPDITVIGGPPYYVLDEVSGAEELGRTVRLALEASEDENLAWDAVSRVAEERLAAVAEIAGVKDWSTYERRTRHVDVTSVSRAEIVVTPFFRRRGYWEPVPEDQWLKLRRPSDRELGDAAIAAIERSSA
jgi:hypothetical protein